MNNKKPKEPLIAVLLSSILAGLGQIYTGRIIRGIVFICISLAYGIVVPLYLINPNNRTSEILLILLPIIVCFWVFVIIDAYRSAKRYNSDNNLNRKISSGLRIILSIGILFFIFNPFNIMYALYIRANIVQAFKVPSGSMEPIILRGDRILVDKMVYKKSDPKRGDVIVYESPRDKKIVYVKRLVGLPNETLEIKDGMILINGAPLKEPSVIVGKHYYNGGDFGKEGTAVKIPESCYYVLGDNPAKSRDSRYYGFVPRKNILGKAFKIYYPFSRSGPIE